MSDADDRTIPATPRRREMARRQGAMPTASLPAWVAAAATTTLLLPAWARATFPAATEMMRGALVTAVVEGASARPLDVPSPPAGLVLPTVAVIAAAGVVGLSVRLVLDGGGWRLGRVTPSLQRISLMAGLSRILSLRTATAAATSGLALAIMMAVTAWSAGALAAILATPEATAEPVRLVPPMQRLFAGVAAAAAVIAACQWGLSRLRFERRIRMTPQEFADEARSMQASPQVRLMQRRQAPSVPRPLPPPDDSATGIRSAVSLR